MKSIQVPHRPQATNCSCGAACLLSCVRYWQGESAPWRYEKALYRILRIGKDGAEPDRIAYAAEKAGLTAKWQQDTTEANLRSWLGCGMPVIILIQAWHDPVDPAHDWANEHDDGHYVVAVGIDDANLYFMDPSCDSAHSGHNAYLPLAELPARWHCPIEGNEDSKGVAIPVRGDKPAPRQALRIM
jgi:predicted double-glycine peptidase